MAHDLTLTDDELSTVLDALRDHRAALADQLATRGGVGLSCVGLSRKRDRALQIIGKCHDLQR